MAGHATTIGDPARVPAIVGVGPIGNHMGHAIAGTVRRLRAGGRYGLLFAAGGHRSRNHAPVPGRDACAWAGPQDHDVRAAADARRGPIHPPGDAAAGCFPVGTGMAARDRAGAPAFGAVPSRTPGEARTIARVRPDDARSIAYPADGRAGPVGAAGIAAREGGMPAGRAA